MSSGYFIIKKKYINNLLRRNFMTLEKKGISGYHLKLFGAALMVLDHIHQMFYYAGAPMALTMVGRLVLPIFIFMCVEGYVHTSNKRKYAIRLFISFLGMTVMTFSLSKLLPLESVVLMNNVFGTMFLSVLLMYVVDCFKAKQWLKAIGIAIIPIATGMLMFLIPSSSPLFYLVFVFPSYIGVEGGVIIVLMAMVMYIFKDKRILQYLAIAIAALLSTGFNFESLLQSNIQWMMIFAIIPIALYNGTRGKGSKYFFYIFYPAHIAVLYILSYIYTTYMLK